MSDLFKWARKSKNGYEVSSKGDKRYSAFWARLKDGRTIEQVFQCDVKGYDPGGTNWKLGKGKPPLDKNVDLWEKYLELWREWASIHPELIEELRVVVCLKNFTLTDMFASTSVNQAHALATILNELFPESK